ncbi:glycosyltransferase family 2 protein [Niabella yanshanensis]|uniref:Glycosyltransferase family 2 protein n=1 Tax=Niabella yanshanensis TaxID=577386 RepID=A0ABZ0W8Q6_9BACT|nr:glycosyltransferase family 2 protein [Niabella yanshanensis]WQD39650.1 glycosyltransferase family 2 protein [Niabella yanshanensis]
MYIFSSPSWILKYRHEYDSVERVPQEVFDNINKKLDTKTSPTPKVTVAIAAWNEEVNILNCISSIADTSSSVPFEIVVVNNNSTDKTQTTLDKLHIRSFFQPVQGCGPARQMGQENARGEYILLADADCIYPNGWMDKMLEQLTQPGVVCVYGRYSFIPDNGYPRWKLFLLERLKDVIAELRHYKRPYLNAFGISMGYVKKYGLEVGFVNYQIRGEDGRLCFDLMKYGKIRQVKSDQARPWTPPRTLQLEGSFLKVLSKRIVRETRRFGSMFVPHPPHDTKTSKNE